MFNNRRSDLQVQISSQQVENNPNSFTYYTSNGSSGYNNGLEIETIIEITPNIQINYSFGYLETFVEIFKYPISDSIEVISGNREQAMAPNYNSSINLYYKHPIGLYFILNSTSKDEYYFSDSHNKKSNPYSIFNLIIIL